MTNTQNLSDMTEDERDALSDELYIQLYNSETGDNVTTREEAEEAFEEEFGEMWNDDYFEVSEFPQRIKDQYPGWYLCKITNFGFKTLEALDEWLVDNVRYGAYKRVGWSSGCSSSVGVCFESGKDAMMYKLRWH